MQDVPKIALKRLQETLGGGTHPDADLLTAFAEQSLVESERARVMEHLAYCSDCRELVALALPATEPRAVTTSTRTSRSAWFHWPVLRWGVVAAGIIAIISAGVLQYRQRHKSDAMLSNLTARNEVTAPPERPLPSPPTTSESQSTILQAENKKQTELRTNARSSSQDHLAADKLVRPANPTLPASRVTRGAGSGSGTSGGNSFSSGGVFPKAALSLPRETSSVDRNLRNATPAEAARLSPDVSAVEASPSSQTIEVESQPAPVTVTAESKDSGQLIENQKEQPSQYDSSKSVGVVAAKNFAAAQDASSLLLAAPRWSISADGVLRRSSDGGNTWEDVNMSSEPVSSPSKVASAVETIHGSENRKKKVKAQLNLVFRAVAAVGPEVWAGGSAATLYHSVDSGAHWARVLLASAGATLTGDITSIEFSDPQHGRIATSTGEVWITADDGQTWQRQ
jgi:hypothetical protein